MNIPQLKVVQELIVFMLQHLLQLRWPITAVLSDDTVTKRSDRYFDLNSEQWLLTKELVKLLSSFEVATTYFGSEANASISSVLPILFGILQASASDHTAIRQFKKEVERQIKRRVDEDSSSILKG